MEFWFVKVENILFFVDNILIGNFCFIKFEEEKYII